MAERSIVQLPHELRGITEYHSNESVAVRAGSLLYVSSLVAIDPATGERELGTVESETKRVLGYQQLEHFRAKSLFEQSYGNRGQRDEHTIGAKQTVRGKYMDMGIECHLARRIPT